MTDPILVTVAPTPAISVTIDQTGSLTGGAVRSLLEAGTPAAVALVTGTAVTVASWLVDTYGTRTGVLELTKTDGSRMVRQVSISVDSPAGGVDAVTPNLASGGDGMHADFTAGAWIDTDVSGAAAAQLVRLRVTALANGASWSAIFYPDFLKAP